MSGTVDHEIIEGVEQYLMRLYRQALPDAQTQERQLVEHLFSMVVAETGRLRARARGDKASVEARAAAA